MEEERVQIGVYAICMNESKFVRQWVESMWCDGQGADMVFVLDTGSTDNTVELLKQTVEEMDIPIGWLYIGAKLYEDFRFDVARNDNLHMISSYVDKLNALVCVDFDETLLDVFWEDLRKCVAEHPNFDRIYYLYAWNHNDNGEPKRVFWYDKIHQPKGWSWIYPCHEELHCDEEYQYEGQYYLDDNIIYLHHWADLNKPRGTKYIPLLELRAKENPDDIYGLFYLMREYLFVDPGSLRALSIAQTQYIKLKSTMTSPTDDYSCLPFYALAIAGIYNHYGLLNEAMFYYQQALEIGRNCRQTYIEYASFLAYHGNYKEAIMLMKEMEDNVPNKYSTWYEYDYNWTWRPLQVKAVAYCWAGEYYIAKDIFQFAIDKYLTTPTDISEATDNGFYRDYQWLIDKMNSKESS